MSRRKPAYEPAADETKLEDAAQAVLDIADAGRAALLAGSSDELRRMRRLCQRLARDAADAALLLSTAEEAAERNAAIAALQAGAGSR